MTRPWWHPSRDETPRAYLIRLTDEIGLDKTLETRFTEFGKALETEEAKRAGRKPQWVVDTLSMAPTSEEVRSRTRPIQSLRAIGIPEERKVIPRAVVGMVLGMMFLVILVWARR